jgi:hypothetical protein
MKRAHCDQCDKPDTNAANWITIKETIFTKVPIDNSNMEWHDHIYGKTIEKDFCSFKCLKEFASKLPEKREGFTLSELLLGLGENKENES